MLRYPRFIFGYYGQELEFRDWECPSRRVAASTVTSEEDAAEALVTLFNNDVTIVERISDEAMDIYNSFKPEGEHKGRIKYNAKRIAILKAAFNNEKEVTALRMQQAIIFMKWQIKLREIFRPGVAKENNREAWFTEHLIPALERAGAYDQFVNWRRISLRNHWDSKIDAGVQLRAIRNLVELGRLIEEEGTGENGKPTKVKFPKVMLRTLKDEA